MCVHDTPRLVALQCGHAIMDELERGSVLVFYNAMGLVLRSVCGKDGFSDLQRCSSNNRIWSSNTGTE